MAPQRQTDRFVANVDPRKSLPDSLRPTVKWKGKVGDNARRKALAVSRSGLHGLLPGPLVFETLEKWRNPSLVSGPSPPPPSPPLYPSPTPARSEPPRFFLPPVAEVPGFHKRSQGWTHPPLRQRYCRRGLLGSGLRDESTGSRFLRAARREPGSKATTRTGRDANTAALRGEFLEVFLLPGVLCGRGSGEEYHREERI